MASWVLGLSGFQGPPLGQARRESNPRGRWTPSGHPGRLSPSWPWGRPVCGLWWVVFRRARPKGLVLFARVLLLECFDIDNANGYAMDVVFMGLRQDGFDIGIAKRDTMDVDFKCLGLKKSTFEDFSLATVDVGFDITEGTDEFKG